jgi:hypothetical protein
MLTPQQVKELSTADLLGEYNMLTGQNVKRFSSRAEGERRLLKIMQELGAKGAEKELAMLPEEENPHKRDAINEKIKISWDNPKVREKRLNRQHIKVDGTTYKSVKEAFIKLGMPIGSHIRFRMKLKKAKTLVVENRTWEVLQ